MTALAMIIGMVPMAFALGEGGEQNAPLGRAVIGGLTVATLATLFFVPTVFSVLHRRRRQADALTENSAVWIVLTALRRPYSFVVLAIIIALFGVRSVLLTPTDIFPNINIPVVSVVWTYNGLLPNDMSGRVIYFYERYLTRAGRRHRAHRIAIAQRLWRRQNLLPEERRHCRRVGAGDGRLADRTQAPAPRHHAALCAELQRFERADPAARAIEQKAAADAAVRSRPELHPAAACNRRRRGGALALRRQNSAGAGRPRPGRHAGPQRVGR